MAFNFGRCPICGKNCLDTEEIIQLTGGAAGFVHLDCLHEAAQDLVDTEAEIGIRAS
jgi:hypothetical protein